MKEPRKPEPVPDWLDLGNLDGLKVGDLVASLRVVGVGKLNISPGLMRVRALEGWRTLLETDDATNPKMVGGFVTNNKGACLSMRGTYYYSANPKHIAAAKKHDRKAMAKAARIEERHAKRMKLARTAGELLGDGEQEYEDCEGSYYRDDVARTLVSRLNDAQIRKLTRWLTSG